jgi:hypothetical protein
VNRGLTVFICGSREFGTRLGHCIQDTSVLCKQIDCFARMQEGKERERKE